MSASTSVSTAADSVAAAAALQMPAYVSRFANGSKPRARVDGGDLGGQ
jgi:hypothetical protein